MDVIHGAWLASAMGIFFGWAVLAWIVRVWAKVRTKSWALDDYAISGAVLAVLLHIACVSYAIAHGYGDPLDTLSASNITKVTTSLYVAQIFYVLSFGLCRESAALFIVYVSQPGPYFRPGLVVAAMTTVWTVGSTLTICLRGNLAHPWAVLDGSSIMFTRWAAVETTGMLVELPLWAVAAHLVWGIRLQLSKRIMIICAFGARLLLVPFLIARLAYLDPKVNTGPARGATVADLLTEACMCLSIMASSATALKPLLTSFYAMHPAAAMDLTMSTSTGMRSKDSAGGADLYYRLETVTPAVLSSGSGGSGSTKVDDIHSSAPAASVFSDRAWPPPTYHGSSHHALVYSRSEGGGSATSRGAVRTSRTGSSGGNKRLDMLTGALKGGRTRERGPSVSSGSDDPGRITIQTTTEVTVQYH